MLGWVMEEVGAVGGMGGRVKWRRTRRGRLDSAPSGIQPCRSSPPSHLLATRPPARSPSLSLAPPPDPLPLTHLPPPPPGRDYPSNFASTAKHIYRQLLRVFAHVYHVHFATVLHLSLEAHWNALFAHFLAFGREFDILDLRDLRSRDPAYVLSQRLSFI